MGSMKSYVERHSPLLPLGIGLLLFGVLWLFGSFMIEESWGVAILIAGAVLMGIGAVCLGLGIISNINAKRKYKESLKE